MTTAAPVTEQTGDAGADADEDADEGSTTVRTLRELPLLLVVALTIAFLVKTFLAQAFYIPSGSMIPQLELYDRVVVSKLAYKLHDPNRGDIVVFDAPEAGGFRKEQPERNGLERLLHSVGERIGVVQPSTDEFIKRVVALPGETVEGRDGKVYVDGRELREPYLAPGTVTDAFPPQTVPKGRLWVMGDNRGHSADSRRFGPVPEDTVVGRAVVRVWPPSRMAFL